LVPASARHHVARRLQHLVSRLTPIDRRTTDDGQRTTHYYPLSTSARAPRASTNCHTTSHGPFHAFFLATTHFAFSHRFLILFLTTRQSLKRLTTCFWPSTVLMFTTIKNDRPGMPPRSRYLTGPARRATVVRRSSRLAYLARPRASRSPGAANSQAGEVAPPSGATSFQRPIIGEDAGA
jgi:hypothetical protein